MTYQGPTASRHQGARVTATSASFARRRIRVILIDITYALSFVEHYPLSARAAERAGLSVADFNRAVSNVPLPGDVRRSDRMLAQVITRKHRNTIRARLQSLIDREQRERTRGATTERLGALNSEIDRLRAEAGAPPKRVRRR